MHRLTIAGVDITVLSDTNVRVSEGFSPFLNNQFNDYSGWTVNIHCVATLPNTDAVVLYQGFEYEEISTSSGDVCRRFLDARYDETRYALTSYDQQNRTVDIAYLDGYQKYFAELKTVFFHIGFERLLLCENRMYLHAACVATKYGGILFSGPSGAGKSTQANLWCSTGKGELINGDRTILHRAEDGWYGWGSPYAGSSECYRNEKCKIRAIVMLKQTDECTVAPIVGALAFQKVYSGLTVNSWNRVYVEQAVDQTVQIIGEVPVYQLSCTPNMNAVEVLEMELENLEQYA